MSARCALPPSHDLSADRGQCVRKSRAASARAVIRACKGMYSLYNREIRSYFIGGGSSEANTECIDITCRKHVLGRSSQSGREIRTGTYLRYVSVGFVNKPNRLLKLSNERDGWSGVNSASVSATGSVRPVGS